MAKRGYKQPGSWATIKAAVLKRDRNICYVCGQPGADTVDHVTPVAAGGTHRTDNLAAIHAYPCHHAKTMAESHAARWKVRQARPTAEHPGVAAARRQRRGR